MSPLTAYGSRSAAEQGAWLAPVFVVVPVDQAAPDQLVGGGLEVVPQGRPEGATDGVGGDGVGVELGEDLAGSALDGGGVVVLVEREALVDDVEVDWLTAVGGKGYAQGE